MAVLDPNEIFFTAFEPKQANRFIMYIDGFPAYTIKGVGAVSLTQGSVALNHINVQRFVKGKTTWNTFSSHYSILLLLLVPNQ
jgi:GTPase